MWWLACAPGPDLGREYTEPTPILDATGAVIAAGWARTPLFGFDRDLVREELRSRVREWDFYAIYAPDFAINFTLARVARDTTDPWVLGSVSVQDYAEDTVSGPSFFLLDHDGAYDPDPAPGADYAVSFTNGSLTYGTEAGQRILSFESDDSGGRVALWPVAESMAVVTPFGDGELFYEDKALPMPASGSVHVGDRVYDIPDGSFAAMDFVRGVMPETMHWTWATAMGRVDGHDIGVNLGSVFGDETDGTPNAVIIDGRLRKLATVTWTIPDDPHDPWTFADDALGLSLVGTHVESQDQTIGTYHAELSKLYGRFSGTLDDGAAVDLAGGAEQAHMAW
jgi:hypothetical protein